MQVLIIEPDSILANIYRDACVAAGHAVLICASAQSAIHAADTIKPDVVVMELQLIEHSGIEFLYEFRSYPDWQDIPVLVHSSVPPAEFAGASGLLHGQLGVRGYYYKPLTSLRTLLGAIDALAAVTI